MSPAFPERGKTPLVGWRGWTPFRPCHLTSNQHVWPVKERIEALCNIKEHIVDTIPADKCSCGIYAFKSADELRIQKYSYQPLLGEVYLWGKVIECEKGYRAQYAYPKKFYARKPVTTSTIDDARWLEYVAWTYNVPIEFIDKNHPLLCEPQKIVHPPITFNPPPLLEDLVIPQVQAQLDRINGIANGTIEPTDEEKAQAKIIAQAWNYKQSRRKVSKINYDMLKGE